jgi:hypothetical protein
MPRNKPKSDKLPKLPGPMIEFDCTECGRHVVRFELPPPGILLCVECVFSPGWFHDPQLRFVFDPWGHCRPPPHETDDETILCKPEGGGHGA